MVTSPTGKGVIVMGGRTTGSVEDSKEMFELSESIQWTKLEPSLQVDHQAFFTIPLPDESVRRRIEPENEEHKCSEDYPSMKHICEIL